jgi:hypothetical protein
LTNGKTNGVTFLKEKTSNVQTRKWQYKHRKLRSAIRSLTVNLPYLFTSYDNPKMEIPNTNNSVEGVISNLKKKIAPYNGLKLNRKMKIINQILAKNQQRNVH